MSAKEASGADGVRGGAGSGGRRLFPLRHLPIPERLVQVQSVGGRVIQQRRHRLRRDHADVNEVIDALNWLHGCTNSDACSGPRGVPNNLLVETQNRLLRLVRAARPRVPVGSPEAALAALLRGRQSYHDSTAPVALASFKDGTVSLPDDVTGSLFINDSRGDRTRWWLEDVELMKRPPNEKEELLNKSGVVPYIDRALKSPVRAYRDFINMLDKAGLDQWTLAPTAHVGIFFV